MSAAYFLDSRLLPAWRNLRGRSKVQPRWVVRYFVLLFPQLQEWRWLVMCLASPSLCSIFQPRVICLSSIPAVSFPPFLQVVSQRLEARACEMLEPFVVVWYYQKERFPRDVGSWTILPRTIVVPRMRLLFVLLWTCSKILRGRGKCSSIYHNLRIST